MSHKVSRRGFLVHSGRAAAGAAVAFPYVIRSGVLAAPGSPGASDRLALAVIGTGGMGNAHLRNLMEFRKMRRVNIAALCDVDDKRLAKAYKSAGSQGDVYRDYRYILERKDVDAVVIATPDHWHAVQTVHACETGKHVYVPTPKPAMRFVASSINRSRQPGANTATFSW